MVSYTLPAFCPHPYHKNSSPQKNKIPAYMPRGWVIRKKTKYASHVRKRCSGGGELKRLYVRMPRVRFLLRNQILWKFTCKHICMYGKKNDVILLDLTRSFAMLWRHRLSPVIRIVFPGTRYLCLARAPIYFTN